MQRYWPSQSASTAIVSSRPVVRLGTFRRSRISDLFQASISSCSSAESSSQLSFERRKVDSDVGFGISSGFHPNAPNSRQRPSATALASSGSSAKSTKYKNGELAAHSSPWNSIGTYGDVRIKVAPILARAMSVR